MNPRSLRILLNGIPPKELPKSDMTLNAAGFGLYTLVTVENKVLIHRHHSVVIIWGSGRVGHAPSEVFVKSALLHSRSSSQQ